MQKKQTQKGYGILSLCQKIDQKMDPKSMVKQNSYLELNQKISGFQAAYANVYSATGIAVSHVKTERLGKNIVNRMRNRIQQFFLIDSNWFQ